MELAKRKKAFTKKREDEEMIVIDGDAGGFRNGKARGDGNARTGRR